MGNGRLFLVISMFEMVFSMLNWPSKSQASPVTCNPMFRIRMKRPLEIRLAQWFDLVFHHTVLSMSD